MRELTPEYITMLLRSGLPGGRSHLKMVPPGRQLTVECDADQLRHSSVLLLLFPFEGKIYTCLTKRAASMADHPGQISLPGGRMEQNEKPEVTALREAREEVGVDPGKVLLLGRLSELYVQVSRFMIYPYVGWVDQMPDFELNVAEAEKLILFPIEEFATTRILKQHPVQTHKGVLEVPCFEHEGEIVWGATAMILSEFLDVLRQPLFTMSQ